jgi:GTP cyclohydrolase II
MNVSQHLWNEADQQDFRFDDAAMRAERAASELRYGRPVLIRGQGGTLAALALDATSPAILDRFAKAAGEGHALYLTGHRAGRLGIEVPGGISVPMRDLDFEAASWLAYGRGAEPPKVWTPANCRMQTAGEVAQLALLLPAMVTAEVPANSRAFDACLAIDTVDLAKARRLSQHFDIVARTPVPLRDLGDCEFVVFRGGVAQRDQIAIIVGNPDTSKPVPVRIHSSCITGDLCGSLKCDCGDQLRNGLKGLNEAGGGVLLYLDQEGRGTGIGAKMRAYGYQHEGLDTIDADAELGFSSDERHYEAAVAMLKLLGVSGVELYTNNPSKMAALLAGGIAVNGRIPVTGRVTADNVQYLRTKTLRAGHMLDLGELATRLKDEADG